MIKTVLIIDDSPTARKILRKCLPDNHDFIIFEAGDGLAGFEQYKEHTPDVTFLDLTMPVMDGKEALEKIRNFDSNAVVIVATADVQPKTLFKLMDLGALMLLRKPISKDTVKESLDNAVQELESQGR